VVQGAAALDALGKLEATDQVRQAAAEAARALIIAGLIEEAVAEEVVATLVEAQLIEEAVAERARLGVAAMQKEVVALKPVQGGNGTNATASGEARRPGGQPVRASRPSPGDLSRRQISGA
jgi:hypothetical protein